MDDLKKEVEELKAWKRSMESSRSIPLNVDQALRLRLSTNNLVLSTHSGETQAVDEGGASTYSVMKTADAFLEIKVDDTTYYVPVFT